MAQGALAQWALAQWALAWGLDPGAAQRLGRRIGDNCVDQHNFQHRIRRQGDRLLQAGRAGELAGPHGRGQQLARHQ